MEDFTVESGTFTASTNGFAGRAGRRAIGAAAGWQNLGLPDGVVTISIEVRQPATATTRIQTVKQGALHTIAGPGRWFGVIDATGGENGVACSVSGLTSGQSMEGAVLVTSVPLGT